jgi:hypothetical protein
MLAESLNMMKTSKFSMKKVFKFGPNVWVISICIDMLFFVKIKIFMVLIKF